jgi:hypothetical protein
MKKLELEEKVLKLRKVAESLNLRLVSMEIENHFSRAKPAIKIRLIEKDEDE